MNQRVVVSYVSCPVLGEGDSCQVPALRHVILTHIYAIHYVGGVLLSNHTYYLENPMGINILNKISREPIIYILRTTKLRFDFFYP